MLARLADLPARSEVDQRVVEGLARSRLGDLTVAEEKKHRKLNPTAGDIRRRVLAGRHLLCLGRSEAKVRRY